MDVSAVEGGRPWRRTAASLELCQRCFEQGLPVRAHKFGRFLLAQRALNLQQRAAMVKYQMPALTSVFVIPPFSASSLPTLRACAPGAAAKVLLYFT